MSSKVVSKSSRSTLHKRTRRIQISLNDTEYLDVELIEGFKGMKIQDFIRALIKNQAEAIRHQNKQD